MKKVASLAKVICLTSLILSASVQNSFAVKNVSANNKSSEQEFVQEKFDKWLQDTALEAKEKGISEPLIEKFLNNTKFLQRTVKLDKKQPFKVLTFDRYKQNIIPQSRIDKARKKLKENRALLEEIGTKYGVQPRFIVSLWAVESDFGNNMGNFNIIDALSSLSYNGRRGEFFKRELFNAMKIIDEGHIEYEDMKGSWAGAMGQSQFMPSSFLELAVDYNGDGKRDIWGSRADVFASIANYLSKRGWNDEQTWGRAVKLPRKFNKKLISSKVTKDLQEWQKLGVRKKNGSDLPKRKGLESSIIRPEDDKRETYVVYPNYKVLLKWNRSLYFATGVGLLSDALMDL